EPQEVSMEPWDTSASLRALVDLCVHYMPPGDLELVRRAYAVAAAAHSGVCRKSGEPFIEHPLAVARTLAELAIDAQGIAAALLHDTVEDTTVTRADVEHAFGSVVARIVDGVTKFTEVEPEGSEGMETPREAPATSGVHLRAESLASEARAQ